MDSDGTGLPVRRGIVAVLDPDGAGLQRALNAGFRLAADERDPVLGMRVVSLAVPAGLSARTGLKRLRRIAPELQADFDHLYEPAGSGLAPIAAAALAGTATAGSGPAIGMIDGGVASHPSLAGKSIEQKGFAGSPQPTGHGTAIASLLVGTQGPFHGAATGARLFVADVYGGSRAAGSATSIVRALGWLSSHRPQVINISLVGPPNLLVRRAVQLVQARGIQVVAAVGNDGPAAPPQYPASYPGVVAVTAVDFERPCSSGGRQGRPCRLCGARRGHGGRFARSRLYASARHQLRSAARGCPPACRRIASAARGRGPSWPWPGRARHRLRLVPDRCPLGRCALKIQRPG